MLISELASRTGFSIDTIRFYEKQGLLDVAHYERGENGYRHYSEAAYQRLMLIKAGQSAGFTLSEMRETICAWETNEISGAEKEAYLCRKLEEVDRKIGELNAMKDFIAKKIEMIRLEPDWDPAIDHSAT